MINTLDTPKQERSALMFFGWLRSILNFEKKPIPILETVLYFGTEPGIPFMHRLVAAYYDHNWSYCEPIGFDTFSLSGWGVSLAFEKSRMLGAWVNVEHMLLQKFPV